MKNGYKLSYILWLKINQVTSFKPKVSVFVTSIYIVFMKQFFFYLNPVSSFIFPDMPKSYMFRMVSMRFSEPKVEKPLPEDKNLTQKLSKNDLSRLKNSHSSFK